MNLADKFYELSMMQKEKGAMAAELEKIYGDVIEEIGAAANEGLFYITRRGIPDCIMERLRGEGFYVQWWNNWKGGNITVSWEKGEKHVRKTS